MRGRLAITVLLAGCAVPRARAVVPRAAAPPRLSILVDGLGNDAELAWRGQAGVSVRIVGASARAEAADPDRWEVSIDRDCGVGFGPTERRALRRGPHVGEAVYDFDWPALANADRLRLVVRRPDVELRYVWKFAH